MEIEDDMGGPDPSLGNGNETTTVSTVELSGILCLKIVKQYRCISGDEISLPCQIENADRDDGNTEVQSIPSIVIENFDEEENTEDQSIPSIMVEKVNEEENTGPLKFLMS